MDEIDEITVEYRTLQDAARQGLIRSLDRAGKGQIEYGGIIFQDPKTGRYYLAQYDGKAMEPVKGERGAVDLRGMKFDRSHKLAGSYHTHPPEDDTGLLSGNDVNVAETSGAPVFMGQAHNREARYFDPGKMIARKKRGANDDYENTPGKAFMPGQTMTPETAAVLALLRDDNSAGGK